MPKLMNIQMELRKVCNHPWLVGGVEETEMDKVEHELSGPTRAAIAGLTTGAGHRRKVKSPAQMEYTDRRMKAFVPTSGKVCMLCCVFYVVVLYSLHTNLTPSNPLLLPIYNPPLPPPVDGAAGQAAAEAQARGTQGACVCTCICVLMCDVLMCMCER